MKNYFYLFLIPVAFACGSKETPKENADSLAVKKDSSMTPSVEIITPPNYLDTLVGKWVEVGKGDGGKYYHSLVKGEAETFISVEKKGDEYLLTTSNLDSDAPGTDVYKLDSIERVFAGTILNTYEYFVKAKNIKDGKSFDLAFTPLHQSMQDAIRISGFAPDEYHQYFMNDQQKDKYVVREEEGE